MKKRLLALAAALTLTLTSCSPAPPAEEADTLHILATTYPVYLFTTAVTEGVEGVEVSLLVNSQTSCLHDYTLTVTDMKAIEGADVIVMNGVGLEDFMADALAQSEATVIDCSEGVELLPALGHEGHDHDTEYDPHIWMDPDRAQQMVSNVAKALSTANEANAALYEANLTDAVEWLRDLDEELTGCLVTGILYASDGSMAAPAIPCWRQLITFHDGFQYFAQAYEMELLKAVEEEEGSEASAADIKEIVGLIEVYDLPAIFTEKNGSDATANAISRETGCAVYQLDMVMSGEGTGIGPYVEAMTSNTNTIAEALA